MSGGSSGSGGTASGGGAPNSGGSSTAGSPSAGGSANAGGAPSSGGTTGGSGGSGNGGGSSEGPGTITDPWRGFCVATFTEDYQVVDPFGAPLFMARAGEEYLIIRYPEPYTSASLAYLTSTGPYEFDVEPNADNTAFPFTTDCPTEFNAGSYFAVFADVSVYAEPELVTKICDLAAGTAVPRDETNAGFALEDVGGTGPSIYEIYLNAFSAQCGGEMSGYISVPRIQLFGSAHVVVPFKVITGPN